MLERHSYLQAHATGPRRVIGTLARSALTAAGVLACAAASAADFSGSVIASGLNNPRGLSFAADGSLYIAEAGLPGGAGPSTLVRGVPNIFTQTGSITRYFNGAQTRVLTGLPSIYARDTLETIGPSDVTFGANGTLFATIGAGVNPNVRSTDLAPNGSGLGRVATFGLSYDVANHEALNNPAGGPLDSNPWNTVADNGALVVTDAGGNSLLRIAPNGTISTIATFPGRDIGGGFPSDAVPTGLAVGADGNYYVGQLTGFPFTPGAAQIYRVEPDGDTTTFASGFTQISALEFGTDGSLYVLEYDANGLQVPGDAGALIRIAPDGSRTTIYDDLQNATGLAIGPDGALYVSNFGSQAGAGEVVRIAAIPEPESYALMLAGLIALGGIARRRRASPL
jgi:glucose/arabinose dehydrogenase